MAALTAVGVTTASPMFSAAATKNIGNYSRMRRRLYLLSCWKEENTMSELEPRIHDETNGLDYVLVGDYYIPAIELPEADDRPIRKWGRMRRAYLEETNPLLLNHLILTGRLHSYLADLNEQAQDRCRLIIQQMAAAEGVTMDLKQRSQWEWVKVMNSINDRAEEVILHELIYTL